MCGLYQKWIYGIAQSKETQAAEFFNLVLFFLGFIIFKILYGSKDFFFQQSYLTCLKTSNSKVQFFSDSSSVDWDHFTCLDSEIESDKKIYFFGLTYRTDWLVWSILLK